MSRYSDRFDCPPYVGYAPRTNEPPTILELAARAANSANRYRNAIDDGANYRVMLRVSGMLARATDELTTAIADSVATNEGRIT